MKILVVMPHFYPAIVYGGPIISSYNTCQELAKLGHEIFVSTTNVNQDKKLDIETNVNIKINENFNVKYYEETIANRFSCQMVRKLWSDIKAVDAVHIQYIFNYCTLVALYYSILQKKKVILSPRGCLGEWCLNQGSKLKKIWNNVFIRPCARKILWHATSEQEKDEIGKEFGEVSVFISPNGIDNNEYQSAVILEKHEVIERFIPDHHKSTYNKLIVSLGRLQKKKGYDILIKAFSETLLKYPDSVLIIAGPDEGEKESLTRIILDKHLADNVYIIDSLFGQDKINFLASADVFAMPSHNENFGNVYLESLAAGTPIIASVFTPWKLVEEFECGKWVEVDILKVSKALNEILMVSREVIRKKSLICAEEFSWAKSAKLISDAITS